MLDLNRPTPYLRFVKGILEQFYAEGGWAVLKDDGNLDESKGEWRKVISLPDQ